MICRPSVSDGVYSIRRFTEWSWREPATWRGSPDGELSGESESNALQFIPVVDISFVTVGTRTINGRPPSLRRAVFSLD